MSKKAIYLRVSSTGQDLGSQEPDLEAWLKVREALRYRDTFTGRTMGRPGIRKLEVDLSAGKVRTVVVWRVDRLGRTAAGMLAFLGQLDAGGVKFVAVRDGFDSDTPAGRLVRGVYRRCLKSSGPCVKSDDRATAIAQSEQFRSARPLQCSSVEGRLASAGRHECGIWTRGGG